MRHGLLAVFATSKPQRPVEDALDATLEGVVDCSAVTLSMVVVSVHCSRVISAYKPDAHLCSMLYFNRSVRDEEQRLDAIKRMFQRLVIVIVSLADGCPRR